MNLFIYLFISVGIHLFSAKLHVVQFWQRVCWHHFVRPVFDSMLWVISSDYSCGSLRAIIYYQQGKRMPFSDRLAGFALILYNGTTLEADLGIVSQKRNC